MLSRKAKAAFFLFASPLMRANGWVYRHLRAPRDGLVRVHLGPGQRTYLDGWINVDANMFTGRCDLWADMRYPLPFADASVDAMYSHHMVEHLPDLPFHFRDVFRCLKQGGVYRVGGPHGDMAIRKFVEGDGKWFGDFPDKRRSLGGRFDNFLLCRQEHLAILTESFLEEMMGEAGFAQLRTMMPTRETGFPDLFADCLPAEYESDYDCPHTLIVEAVRPRA